MKHLALHRPALEQVALRHVQAFQPRREQSLDRRRHRLRSRSRASATLCSRNRGLSIACGDDPRSRVGVETVGKLLQQHLGLPTALAAPRTTVALTSPRPSRPILQQFGACGAQDEDGSSTREIDHVIEQVQQHGSAH